MSGMDNLTLQPAQQQARSQLAGLIRSMPYPSSVAFAILLKMKAGLDRRRSVSGSAQDTCRTTDYGLWSQTNWAVAVPDILVVWSS